MRLLIIRPYRQDDVPFMVTGSASNSWDLVPEADRTPEARQRSWMAAHMNLMGVLGQRFNTALVAEEEGRPAAFILLAIGPDTYTGQIFGYLADIYVAPAFRRRGLSIVMHREAERFFRERGIHIGKLWIGAANQAALESAKKAGFGVEAYVLSKQYT